MLVLVAAGLVASTLHSAHEAGWLNAGQGQALDLTWLVVPGLVDVRAAHRDARLAAVADVRRADRLPRLPGAGRGLRARGRRACEVRARAPMSSGRRVVLLLLVLVLAGCGGRERRRRAPPAPDGRQAVELKLTDAGCSPSTLKLDAGRTTFKVTNAGTGRVSELEVLQGARILGEKENLVAGLSGLVHADAPARRVHAQLPGRRRPPRPAC